MAIKIKFLIPCILCVLTTMMYLSSYGPIFNVKNTEFHGNVRHPSTSPLCFNILSNLTDGTWVRKIDLVTDKNDYERLFLLEHLLDIQLTEFRIKRGLHTRLWRDDGKCGYKNQQAKPKGNQYGGPLGAWCDAKSQKPCCSDETNGVCGNLCNCTKCINLRKIYHAEVSEWIESDSRCRHRNYTSQQACNVLKKFDEIHFVGDSFARKMARALVLVLRSDLLYGAMAKHYNEHLKKLCVGVDQFYWTQCRTISRDNMLSSLVNNSPFCGDSSPKIADNFFYNNKEGKNFLNLVKNLAGKRNTVIFLSIGVHDLCNANSTQTQYLGPALRYLEEYAGKSDIHPTFRWPNIVFMYPDTQGLLKSLSYRNGKAECNIYKIKMELYCKQHNVSIFDFSKVSSGVHSYDGTHHGLGVNILKVQLMLNYLDSISRKGY